MVQLLGGDARKVLTFATFLRQLLKGAEKAYSEIGSAGYFALNNVIRPLRDQFNNGERTDDLYKAIMDIAL